MSIRKMEPDELKYCEIAARSHPIIIGASVISPFSTVQRYLSSSGILSCLKKDAIVNEIKNGKRIQLNQSNYDTVEEEVKIKEVEPEKKEEKIIETVITEEEESSSVADVDDILTSKEEDNKDEEEIETSTIIEEEVVEEKTETTTETPSYNKNRKKKRH